LSICAKKVVKENYFPLNDWMRVYRTGSELFKRFFTLIRVDYQKLKHKKHSMELSDYSKIVTRYDSKLCQKEVIFYENLSKNSSNVGIVLVYNCLHFKLILKHQ